jgi:hypothetical protein
MKQNTQRSLPPAAADQRHSPIAALDLKSRFERIAIAHAPWPAAGGILFVRARPCATCHLENASATPLADLV